MGVVSPVGNDLETFWKSLIEGRSGIRRFQAFDSTNYDCKIAGEVPDFEPVHYFKNPKSVKRTDRFTQFAMAGAKMAIEDSNIDLDQVDRNRFGVMIGSGIGGLYSMEQESQRLMTRGPSRVSPFTIAMMISNMASGIVSMEYDLRGPNMCIVTACATANNSIGEAWRIIKFGDADAFIAGGCEATITPLGIGGFASMKALSLRNDDPTKACRPFDRDRDGFVMSEGAGIVVLEEYEHAKKRGAKIYCELAGYGCTADAYHMTAPMPEGEGAARAIQIALRHGKVNPEEVDYINAHGTSTPQGDICETQAIKSVLGAHARKVAVSSTKSSLGHLLGAAGSVEMAICLKALETNILPATINLEEPDPECDLDYIPQKPREQKANIVMNNSFGFGGHNACLIASRLV